MPDHVRLAQAGGIQTGAEAFGHIGEEFRGKVATDLLERVTPAGRWRFDLFNSRNDYQRHLYALFLKLAGFSYGEIEDVLEPLLVDVSPERHASYLSDLLHSEIVGFPRADGKCIMLPAQSGRAIA